MHAIGNALRRRLACVRADEERLRGMLQLGEAATTSVTTMEAGTITNPATTLEAGTAMDAVSTSMNAE